MLKRDISKWGVLGTDLDILRCSAQRFGLQCFCMRALSMSEILGPGGLLARALPSYESRPQQLEMAERVADALKRRRPLIVEAATGTGKTLAYLVPAILSGDKVIISTGTKNLQEQIFRKDIPLLERELPMKFEVACIKGISNYLCRRRLSETLIVPESIAAWAKKTESGDRAELGDLADDAPEWLSVSATAETRLGPRCSFFESCFVTRARKQAQAAQLVIVNHHLFFADLALKQAWPEAQLLPKYEAVIFDEAHQLEDVITDYFGVRVSTQRVAALLRDVKKAVQQNSAPPRSEKSVAHLEKRAAEFFDCVRQRIAAERTALTSEAWEGEPTKAAHALDTALEEVSEQMGATQSSDLADGGRAAESLGKRARAIRDDLALLIEGARKPGKQVYWAECRGHSVMLQASPIDVSEIVREKLLSQVETAIFTSATLTTSGSFEFFRSRLGLESAMEARLASPFSYATQALLYLPADLPDPQAADFVERAAERIETLLAMSRGRAFLLFTSHRQLQRVLERLRPRIAHPILVQGEAPKHLLIEKFRQQVGSVLFATASFWEGVDVVGEALELVVIDKLPFAPPDDPLLQARARKLEESGRDPFRHYQIPRAALALAQGFGRLIRHQGDRGVVALLDRRATTKGYGRRVLGALPEDCPRTASIDEVAKFFALRPFGEFRAQDGRTFVPAHAERSAEREVEAQARDERHT